MSALELLTWARGPGLSIALSICAFGILLRLFEIFGLGRKADLSKPRDHSPGSGFPCFKILGDLRRGDRRQL